MFFLSVFLCVGFFFVSGVLNEESVDKKAEDVPYYEVYYETRGILVELHKNYVFFEMNFETEELTVIYVDENFKNEEEIYGYSLDYFIKADFEALEILVDSVSGVELTRDGETLSYTGVQISELLCISENENEVLREIIEILAGKIAKNGIIKDDFYKAILKCETSLTLPDYHYWPAHLKNMCKNIRFVN